MKSVFNEMHFAFMALMARTKCSKCNKCNKCKVQNNIWENEGSTPLHT